MCADVRRAVTLAAVLLASAPVCVRAAYPQPPLSRAAIVEHLGAPVPRDLPLTDSSGRDFQLAALLDGRTPLIISLAYFRCPMLCPLGQQSLADALRDSGLHVGTDVRVLTVSIDPGDTPALAGDWKRRADARLGTSPDDWRFAVGREREVRRLADTVGFAYAYDPRTNQYSHPAALFVIGADGAVARYVYGMSYDPVALKTSIEAARANQRGGTVERFLLRCFHYVPSLRQHGSTVAWTLRAGGGIVTLLVAGALLALWRRER
jgi:protein SCO1/2